MNKKLHAAILIDETVIDKLTYFNTKISIYQCPCGMSNFTIAKEFPNGRGNWNQIFSTVEFWNCKKCKSKYNFVYDKYFEELSND